MKATVRAQSTSRRRTLARHTVLIEIDSRYAISHISVILFEFTVGVLPSLSIGTDDGASKVALVGEIRGQHASSSIGKVPGMGEWGRHLHASITATKATRAMVCWTLLLRSSVGESRLERLESSWLLMRHRSVSTISVNISVTPLSTHLHLPVWKIPCKVGEPVSNYTLGLRSQQQPHHAAMEIPFALCSLSVHCGRGFLDTSDTDGSSCHC